MMSGNNERETPETEIRCANCGSTKFILYYTGNMSESLDLERGIASNSDWETTDCFHWDCEECGQPVQREFWDSLNEIHWVLTI
jgi:hypothetical protein